MPACDPDYVNFRPWTICATRDLPLNLFIVEEAFETGTLAAADVARPRMLLGITGPRGSGKRECIRFLKASGFEVVTTDGREPAEILEYITPRWQRRFVILINTKSLLELCSRRPFFVHLHVDAGPVIRWKRQPHLPALDEFLSDDEDHTWQLSMARSANICLLNNFDNLASLHAAIATVNVDEEQRMRPDWDTYFMRLADLAALRANCMKRRVGCVIVRDRRVIATGYNGTPRGLTNCNNGGCPRCNDGEGSGVGLGTCLCLHAEENALLEAGRDRVGMNSTLYCNTCPCLTCSIKISQSGIVEVVYSQAYSMDEATSRVLAAAGVKLRKYTAPVDSLYS